MNMSNYPDGAENDPNAPWNQKDVTECDECGNQAVDELIQEMHGQLWLCEACADLIKCHACKHWYYNEDVIGDVCVDCAESELREEKECC